MLCLNLDTCCVSCIMRIYVNLEAELYNFILLIKVWRIECLNIDSTLNTKFTRFYLTICTLLKILNKISKIVPKNKRDSNMLEEYEEY